MMPSRLTALSETALLYTSPVPVSTNAACRASYPASGEIVSDMVRPFAYLPSESGEGETETVPCAEETSSEYSGFAANRYSNDSPSTSPVKSTSKVARCTSPLFTPMASHGKSAVSSPPIRQVMRNFSPSVASMRRTWSAPSVATGAEYPSAAENALSVPTEATSAPPASAFAFVTVAPRTRHWAYSVTDCPPTDTMSPNAASISAPSETSTPVPSITVFHPVNTLPG